MLAIEFLPVSAADPGDDTIEKRVGVGGMNALTGIMGLILETIGIHCHSTQASVRSVADTRQKV